jgi:hypothetical protein
MNVFHYVCVFLGHQAWVFIVVIRQGIDKVMFSCMHHHYVSKKKANPGHSSWTKCCTKAEGNINTNKDFCLPTGAPAAPWAPASQKKSSQTFILEGWYFDLNHCRLLPYNQQNVHPIQHVRMFFYHACRCVHTWRSMIAPMCAYTSGHDSAYVHIHASETWSDLCVNKRVCMITLMCTCKCVHDRAYLYIRTSLGMIGLMCAYTRMGKVALMCTYIHV